MRKAKTSFFMLQGMIADWLHSPRTVISAVMLLALAYMNARSFAYLLETGALYAYPGETVYHFLATGFGNVSLTSALFLIMMAEIPRHLAFQNMLLIRSSHKAWLASQVLFCCLITAAMIGLMLVLSLLFSFPSLSAGTGWSDLERLAADPDAAWMPQLTSVFIRAIPPWVAALLAFLILFFFWLTMTLVILLCTLLGKPNAGVIVYVSLLVLNVTVAWEALPRWMRTMPIQFSTMAYVGGTFPERELQAVPCVIGAYLLIDLLLILLMHTRIRRMELFFIERR